MRPALLLAATLMLLAGCKREDMYVQRYYRNWNQSSFFGNGTGMRHPPEGTVARTPYRADVHAPTVISEALLERGKERYDIFCTPCHGRAGHGDGMIVQRGFPAPPSFVEGALRKADNKVFYDAITNGYGAMYSFDTRVAPADRWAVISYIRALQRSQNTAVASLPPDLQARLDAIK
ncbi:MAG: cytochrome c [Acetobacteraceae bacterium]|nr:cytochrome c [Acetobacteraceae bacterium]